MDILKKTFPFSFKEKKDVATLVIYAILHTAIGIAVGFAFGILGKLPIVGQVFNIIGDLTTSAVGLYLTVGTVLCFLDYFKVIK